MNLHLGLLRRDERVQRRAGHGQPVLRRPFGLTSFTDSNGNNVAYEYDALGRVSKLTPAQGSSYRTEYQYKKNGSLSKVKVYDAGSSADTDYTYSTTSGLLTQRDFPTVSSNHIRTAYAYDSAGRLVAPPSVAA